MSSVPDPVMAQTRPGPPRLAPLRAQLMGAHAGGQQARAPLQGARSCCCCAGRERPERRAEARRARARAAAGAQGPAGESQGLAAPPAQPADHGQDPEAGHRGHCAHELTRRAGAGLGFGIGQVGCARRLAARVERQRGLRAGNAAGAGLRAGAAAGLPAELGVCTCCERAAGARSSDANSELSGLLIVILGMGLASCRARPGQLLGGSRLRGGGLCFMSDLHTSHTLANPELAGTDRPRCREAALVCEHALLHGSMGSGSGLRACVGAL